MPLDELVVVKLRMRKENKLKNKKGSFVGKEINKGHTQTQEKGIFFLRLLFLNTF